MILVPAAIPERAPAFRRLVDPQIFPQARGGLTVEAIAAGARAEEATGSEAVTVLLAGRASWAGGTIGPGAGLYHPSGSRYGLSAGATPAVVLTVHALPGPAAGGDSVPLARQREGGVLTRAGGFAGMGVHWLATAATVGSRQLALATSTFTPSGSHDLHCHPDADEFFLVLAGGGDHLTEGGRVRLAQGDLAYVPAGEWHGFRTRRDVTTVALYGYLGAAGLEQAGYRIKEAA
ncbi:cupin domain-containing protein [Kitasatospora sp. MAP5-34]|uniref:cupin domain-containing protein n=1 Tax=Kitasatospora sp. MAP5-34 TaxID=3035102 RepID=UPI0024766124|nr:cupin domain-containing protein [Kitasatospora sp. MAP5-34]MDH6575360.1 quercetin dioxygenase-like cupin family protein [Kitasatospora sp. MAP5-34]